MDQQNKPSKTLPYTFIAVSVILLLILISGVIGSGKFSIGPLAIILFVVTFIVVGKAWSKKKSG